MRSVANEPERFSELRCLRIPKSPEVANEHHITAGFMPTNSTKEGPRFRGDDRQVVVDYDYVKDDGTTEWSSIVFADVLQFEFRPGPCFTAEDVLSATEIRVQTMSQRVATMLERWQEAVGWQEWQQKQGGRARYKHFTIYFDDAGIIDVIAAECRPSTSR